MSAQLPAGLIDNNVELFVRDNILYALYNGSRIFFNELPFSILALYRDDMKCNKCDIYAQVKCGSEDEMHILVQYCKCNYGNFNNEPDMDEDGQLNREYVNCGERGTCLLEGKLCKHIKVQNGFLSPREIDFLKLVVSGKFHKEIATEMNIAESTVPCYAKKIQEKTGCQTKTEMAVFALKKGII